MEGGFGSEEKSPRTKEKNEPSSDSFNKEDKERIGHHEKEQNKIIILQ